MDKGILYVVATPIGNLKDITLRAIEVLQNVDLIACEDTRHTGMLLKSLSIKKPMVSYFQHSKLDKIEYIIDQLLSGNNIALVTDAGTPGISDPGQALISQIRNLEQEIKIIPVPGASALAASASVSGLVEKELYFAGFLPKKKGRQTQFKRLVEINAPIIFYESANRLERTLGDIRTYFGDSVQVFIAREMTKVFEEYWGGEIEEVIFSLNQHKIKGEIVIIIKPNGKLKEVKNKDSKVL